MVQPKVIKKTSEGELWLFKGQYYYAVLFSDGICQVRLSDKEGRSVGLMALNSHNTHDRIDAVKWLNEYI